MNEIADSNARIYAEVAMLKQEGYDTANIFITQEGAIYSMEGATCPRCAAPSELSHRTAITGYFRCPACDVLHDEPNFTEADFITSVEDDE